jgi:hypothetical protein
MNYELLIMNYCKLSIIFAFCAFAMVSCAKNDSSPVSNGGASESGQGGSMARFAVQGNYLYTLDNSYVAKYDISQPASIENIIPKSAIAQYWVNGETVFVRDSLLYVGSSNGMYIMDLQTLMPLGQIEHFLSCDPVVVKDTLAYVTLNVSSNCRWGMQQSALQIYNVKNPRNPVFIRGYAMEAPQGLALRDSLLFVCDEGVKVYDARKPLAQLPRLSHIKNVDGYDVILEDTTLFLIGNTGFFQYAYHVTNADSTTDKIAVTLDLLSSIVPTKEKE